MRNTNDIPKEEFEGRLKSYSALMNEPYVKALQARQNEFFASPDCNEWQNISGIMTFGMKPEYKAEFDQISEELQLFRRNKYPELVFEPEYDDKLNEVNLLKENGDYKNYIKGITYFTGEMHIDKPTALAEIKNLNQQISILINRDFPSLFTKGLK